MLKHDTNPHASRRIPLIAAAVASALLGVSQAHADELSELRGRLDEQEQKIKVLERKLELEEEAKKAATSSAPVVKAGPRGFSIGTPDNANVLKLRGVLHFDGRRFHDDVTPSTCGYLPSASRSSDDRRHAQRHLRFQIHARLRWRPHDHSRRLLGCTLGAVGDDHGR
jgi:hypothetical protein